MKRIEAFVQPHRREKVISALHALPNFPGFTLEEALGQGCGRGAGGAFAYDPEEGILYHPCLHFIVICANDIADQIATTIAKAAHIGNTGDGIVTISDVSRVIRIRDAGENA